jgi:L-threonylcarbamoyladenylate synthase
MLRELTNYIPDTDITSVPTTVIYQNINGLSDNLLEKNGTAAIRIVQDDFCKQLIEKFGKAIVSTSANISGTKSPEQFSDICNDIIDNADYIVNLRKKERRENPSKIIKIEKNGSITKLR